MQENVGSETLQLLKFSFLHHYNYLSEAVE